MHLLELARNGDSEMRFIMAQTIWLRDSLKNQDGPQILGICAKDENINVSSRVSMALSKKGGEFPEQSLRIIKEWIMNDKYFKIYELDYTIREIGKHQLDRCISEVVSWIGEKDEKGYLQFFIPIVLRELSTQNYIQLLASVITWWFTDKLHQKIALETIKKVLTEIYPPTSDKLAIVDSYFNFLKEIAEKENIDVAGLIKEEPEKVFQCLLIIDELNGNHIKPVFDLVMKNLEEYPTIRDFIGIKWFKSWENKKNNPTHPLLPLLSAELDEAKLEKTINAFKTETDAFKRYMLYLKIRSMITPMAFLDYLEAMLKVILSKSAKVKALRDGIKNRRQFLDTVSEIETISSFIDNYPVDIGPELNGKKLDLKIGFIPEIYVEVISPDMFKPLKYLNGKALNIKNRARGKILDELEHHFKDVDALGNTPWIIVIDLGRSEMSYDFIEDALIGSEKFTLMINKESGAIVGQSLSRTDDSVHDIEKATDILSAVICYKANLGTDGKFHREGKIIPNRYAKNPLSKETLDQIEKIFLK